MHARDLSKSRNKFLTTTYKHKYCNCHKYRTNLVTNIEQIVSQILNKSCNTLEIKCRVAICPRVLYNQIYVKVQVKERSLSCEKILPGSAWLMLSKTGPPFTPFLHVIVLLDLD